MENLRFNTAIARITELNNEITRLPEDTPREVAEKLVLLLSPLVPHIAEELWEMLGNNLSVVYADFPTADESFLTQDTIEIPIQINGKVKSKIVIAADTPKEELRDLAISNPKISSLISGKEIRKEIIVEGKLVNFVV
tara:strand:- start:284 stop:697 length:414 start_codon:yes stop_codon:yes gene_type:complete